LMAWSKSSEASNWWALPSQKSRQGQQHEKIIQQVVDSVHLVLQIF
jgi:hypothetical protein